ncbi:27280_t:CDS:10 [Dentiscutata erythropus]|uniref:27280_t:CDS:1 n=1 Tax=Dentiscutata erythropus TaxID=1348616 RepID=A0A9N9HHG4_9GLOM|nr:27280_t:CDS:10 [Dentiscutata erythropus]
MNTDFIAKSFTSSSDILGLKGAWIKRFASTAKILNAEESILHHFLRLRHRLVIVGLTGCGYTSQHHPRSTNWSCIVEKWYTKVVVKKVSLCIPMRTKSEQDMEKSDIDSFAASESNTTSIQEEQSSNESAGNTYDQGISINENILRMHVKYFGDFIPHFIKYKELQKNNQYSCANDDVMDIRGESGFSKFLTLDDYIKLRTKNPKRKVELPEDWCNFLEEYFKETTKNGSIKSVPIGFGAAKEGDNKEVIKLKKYLNRVMLPLIESFSKSTPDISAPNSSEHPNASKHTLRPSQKINKKKIHGALQEFVGLDWRAVVEKTGEEIFVGEQAGLPTKCDL